jgi:hypothetical protein
MLLYRTAGAWGPGVGANLTPAQVDANFYDISTRVQFLELHPPEPVLITSFTTNGDQIFIHMSDGTINGPVTLPVVRWNSRGAWTPSTVYFQDDIVIGPDSAVYLVKRNHTSSASSFDPYANDGAGHDYYSLLLTVPAATLPTGGGPGYVLTKATTANYDVVWGLPQAPAGGSAGQVLQKNTATDGDASWNTLAFGDLGGMVIDATPADWDYLRWDAAAGQWINQQSLTLNVLSASSWVPAVGDDGAFMVLTNGTTATTITIPADATEPFPVGTELHIHQDGTGVVTVTADTGVTIRKHVNFSNHLLGQYATATVKKTAANEWRLFGLLAAA